MIRHRFFCRIAAASILAVQVVTVAAQVEKPENNNEWSLQISPYFWMAGVHGKVGASQHFSPTSIDLNFGDVFNHIQWPSAVFLSGEAWNGSFGLLADIEYLKLKEKFSSSGSSFSEGRLGQNNFNSTIAGIYKIGNLRSMDIQGLGGIRIFSIDNEISFHGGYLSDARESSGNTWADPIIGIRAIMHVTPRLVAKGYADLGGFGISSDWTWQVRGGIEYAFSNSTSVYIQYRYMYEKRKDGGFLYDMTQQGPLIGVNISF